MRKILEIHQDDANFYRRRDFYVGLYIEVIKAYPNGDNGWLYAKGKLFNKDSFSVDVIGTGCNIITFWKVKLGGEIIK